MRPHFGPIALALTLLLTPSVRAESPATDGDAAFAAALHGKLRARPGNLFYSPESARMALAMAWAGARGETAAEMERALGLDKGTAGQMAGWIKSWAALASPPIDPLRASASPPMQQFYEQQLERDKVILRVVNRLWAQAGHPFRDDFLARLRDDYRAPLGPLDFKRDPEAGRAAINKWVADATEQKIKQLIGAGMITTATRLVLTNAVYFKAHWHEPFEAGSTKPEPFFVAPGKEVRAPLMRDAGHFAIARIEGGQLCELPYGDGRLVMDVVLPDQRDGLAKLEERYAAGAFGGWVKHLSHEQVIVFLPRFTVRSSLALSEPLAALGMRRAFTYPDADFSGVDNTHELFISQVVQQAFVAVDENGTEAAAATAVMMEAGAAPNPHPLVFRADHPFLFLIRDTSTNVVLFAGRLADPSQGG